MINYDIILGLIINGIFSGIGIGLGIYFGNKLLITRLEKISKTSVQKALEERGFKIIEK